MGGSWPRGGLNQIYPGEKVSSTAILIRRTATKPPGAAPPIQGVAKIESGELPCPVESSCQGFSSRGTIRLSCMTRKVVACRVVGILRCSHARPSTIVGFQRIRRVRLRRCRP